MCDFSDVYLLAKARINNRTVINTDINKKDAAFKNNVSFRSCITKISNTLTDSTDSYNCSMT